MTTGKLETKKYKASISKVHCNYLISSIINNTVNLNGTFKIHPDQLPSGAKYQLMVNSGYYLNYFKSFLFFQHQADIADSSFEFYLSHTIVHVGIFINVFSRRATGFHRWPKLFELDLFIRKTLN